MTIIDLNLPQTLHYSDFLLALSEAEYVDFVYGAAVDVSLHTCVVDYANTHYPKVTIVPMEQVL